MLDKLLFLLGLAGVAVVYADVLVRDGMLLAPVQAWVREWHKRSWVRGYSRELFDALPPVEAGLPTFEKWGRCNESGERAYYEIAADLDNRWWWAPLWGCPKCCCGQWCLWLFIIRYHPHTWAIGWWGWACWVGSLLVFVSWGILATMGLMKFSKWTQE